MLCDGRLVCGCADPYGHRVLGDARPTSMREVWTGAVITALRDRAERRRIEVLRRLPAQAAAEARTRRRRCGRSTPVRCRPDVSSSARRRATSRASRRAARPKPASRGHGRPACSTSSCSAGSSTKSGPTLGRIDFFNYGEAFLHKRADRDVRVHQDAASRTSISTRARTASRYRRAGAGGWCTPASTR